MFNCPTCDERFFVWLGFSLFLKYFRILSELLVSIISIAISVINVHGKHGLQNMKKRSDEMFSRDIFRGSEYPFHCFALTKS